LQQAQRLKQMTPIQIPQPKTLANNSYFLLNIKKIINPS
jgi:hypothetical protein